MQCPEAQISGALDWGFIPRPLKKPLTLCFEHGPPASISLFYESRRKELINTLTNRHYDCHLNRYESYDESIFVLILELPRYRNDTVESCYQLYCSGKDKGDASTRTRTVLRNRPC
jgi:hypothetical protein